MIVKHFVSLCLYRCQKCFRTGTIKLHGAVFQRLKSLGTTPRDWGPRHLEHEPQFELPDYVICSPDVYRPANALALLTANLYLPNIASFLSVEQEVSCCCSLLCVCVCVCARVRV